MDYKVIGYIYKTADGRFIKRFEEGDGLGWEMTTDLSKARIFQAQDRKCVEEQLGPGQKIPVTIPNPGIPIRQDHFYVIDKRGVKYFARCEQLARLFISGIGDINQKDFEDYGIKVLAELPPGKDPVNFVLETLSPKVGENS